jgi:hypothetical protein
MHASVRLDGSSLTFLFSVVARLTAFFPRRSDIFILSCRPSKPWAQDAKAFLQEYHRSHCWMVETFDIPARYFLE